MFLKKHKTAVRADLEEKRKQITSLNIDRDKHFLDSTLQHNITKKLTEMQAQYDEMQRILDRSEIWRNARKKDYLNNKCSKYFFRKIKGVAGALRFMFDDNNEEMRSDNEILHHCAVFYDNLYSKNSVPAGIISNFVQIPEQCKLFQKHKQVLSEPLTQEELHLAVKKMKAGASPGQDGLTVSFYREFWGLVGNYVYNSAISTFKNGSFSLDQCRGILKLILKKLHNPGFVKNLRPIMLLNVDYKMVTKALAMRLKDIIPVLIDPDQKGFVKSQYLGENVIEVQTLMNMASNYQNGDEFALFSLDIEKAFDSINWHFMFQTLQSFGFPEHFLHWVKVIQTNVQLTVLNNGHMSPPLRSLKGWRKSMLYHPSYLFS